ncbi:hypothetical protein DY000_02016153 [Brassica cretica]|uniref:Uncharacterized protein n=1 Tax=Brassica cretica TaxID=69181 RepID=A0ABQ7CNW6_BRACR|nr:hypothetical protein DY000_02016153 [Brassica cretica]
MAAHTRDTMHTEEYDEDYKEERAIEYSAILDEEDRLLHHSSWKRNAPSIGRTVSPSIDTHLHQTSQKRASTDIAYYPSIDTGVDRAREGDYSIGNWEDNHHHESYAVESYAVETVVHELGADELHEGFTYEELLNMQRRDEPDQHRAEACGERTSFSHSFEKENRLEPDGYARAIDGHALQISREDIADILQMANGADNLFLQQHTVPAHQQRVTNEFYDTPEFGRRAYDRDGTRRSHWAEKDEYGVYRDDQGHARDVDGHIIRVSKDDIRILLERASRDEHNYICLPEHASSFTQTKLVPEIYTKDEINEMFYGVCGAQEKNESDFQMKLYGVYYPLNDSISWLTSCMEEMRQDIARIQTQRAAEANAPASIDSHHSTSIDDNPQHSHSMKSQPDFHTREEIDQLVEEIYRTLETTEERLDRRCDDIYFPMDLTMSSLTSQIEAIHRELVEIQRYIARRPEALASIDRSNKRSIDKH